MRRRWQSRHPVAIARRATRRRAEGHDDAGFTLIELIVVIAILPIVVGGITVALLAVFGLQNQTTNRIGDSNDALTSSSVFNKDVQSALQIETLAIPACGTSSQTQLLGMEWALDANGNYDTVVSYVLTNGNGFGSGQSASKYLVRQTCTSGASTTPTTSTVVSHDAGTPVTAFNPTGFLATGYPGTGATWKSTQGLYGVTLSITAPGSSFPYTLSGLPSASTSTGQLATVSQAPNPAGCNLASPKSGTYAQILCFADFTGFTDPSSVCQQMKLSIANSPDFLQFCIIETPTDTAAPQQLPTYYGPTNGGYNSEAFLGNNGFYTGVAGLPALSQRQTSIDTPTWPNGFAGVSNQLTTITFSNIQVVNAVGEPATGWSLVTGDAESTDTNGWLEFQNSTVQWNILPNSSTSLWGNSCYDSQDSPPPTANPGVAGNTANNGVLSWTGSVPPTTAQVGMYGTGGTGQAPASQYARSLPATAYVANTTTPSLSYNTDSYGVLCQADVSLNKTGSLMVSAPEPSGSSAAQNVTVTMQGESQQAIFLGVLL